MAFRPNVEFRYRQVSDAEFETALLDALTAGESPDVFMVRNHDMRKRLKFATPAPVDQFSLVRMRELFPAVAEQNFVIDGGIYALPLYLDTLALVYDKDALDQKGVASPPATWQEFQALVPRLRTLNAQGQIIRGAAAIGGSERTVAHAVDLVQLIMMQNGAQMARPEGSAAFAGSTGLQAFEFYLQFSSPGSPFYTWGASQGQSLEGFASGKTVMAFAYHSDLEAIARRSPFLNFGIAPMPQVFSDRAVNYPQYHGLAVSRRSKSPQYAWDFVIFATTNPEAQRAYGEAVQRPPALRPLLAEKKGDPRLSVFVSQALTARSWPIPDYDKMRTIFDGTIEDVLGGKLSPGAALTQAQDLVNQLISAGR